MVGCCYEHNIGEDEEPNPTVKVELPIFFFFILCCCSCGGLCVTLRERRTNAVSSRNSHVYNNFFSSNDRRDRNQPGRLGHIGVDRVASSSQNMTKIYRKELIGKRLKTASYEHLIAQRKEKNRRFINGKAIDGKEHDAATLDSKSGEFQNWFSDNSPPRIVF